MQIAIITWCTYTNFGTYLQAYALQHYLKEKGYYAKLLDDSMIIPNVRTVKHRFLGPIKKFIKYQLRPSLKTLAEQDATSLKLYKDFRNKYLDIDNDIFPLSELDGKYDTYICGSDQIWSPIGFELDKNKDFYFASFSSKKKIAYAPSIGVSKISPKYESHYKQLLSGFTCLSARENAGVSELSRITQRHIMHVVDPTLLLSSTQWESLLSQSGKVYQNKERYILLYLLTYNKKYIQYASSFARQRGLALKVIHSINVSMKSVLTENAGPLEFLNFIKNADFILTDSFHGTIFSIIFEKQFVTFKRFKDSDKNSQNSRVIDLLKSLNLEKRLVEEESITIEKINKIDYSSVEKLLNSFIQSSKDYLDKALNS